MTRKDIRRGTTMVLLFCSVAFLIIAVTLWRQLTAPVAEIATQTPKSGPVWSERLTNELSDQASLHPMDAEIERFMGKWDIKGMQLAVVRHDSLIYTKGYGWADREAGVKMEPTNIMRMASASKLVTAIAVMRLCEQGKLTLGSKVFGPEGILNDTLFTNAVADKRIFDITIDHLLQHKGGFGLGAGDPMFNTRDIIAAKHLSGPPSPDQLTAIVLGRRIAFTPGAGRRYSNFGYFLLSQVIEKVTGQSYWDYLQEEVLQPAGCHMFRPATDYYADRHRNEVKYYGPDDEMVEEFNGSGRMVPRIYGGSDVNGLKGAGGWCASAAGLARLVAAADGDKRLKDIISPKSVALLTEHADKDKLSRGWSECDVHGRWTRTGTLSSTHALIERFPDGECWVLLTNSGVWTGHHFSRDLNRLVEHLRPRYRNAMPRRNLF